MGFKFKCSKVAILALATLLLFGLTPAAAEEKSADEWAYDAEVYFWLPNINIGTNNIGPIASTNIKLTLKDLLKNLDMMAMVDFGARKNRWSYGVDMIWMNLGAKQTVPVDFLGHPQELTANIDMRAFISTAKVGYEVISSEQHYMDFIGGVRYLYLRVPLKFDLNENTPRTVRLGGVSWNGIAGLEGKYTINDKWYFDYYGT